MEQTIRRLRKKYILTAALIAFIVIVLMIVILNLLMGLSYSSRQNMLSDVMLEAALSDMGNLNTETIQLSDMEKNEDGDFIVPRDVREIERIVLHGNIECTSDTASWYSAGGGLMFDIRMENRTQLVYKEYTFNKDTTDISIDFTSLENVKAEGSGNLIKIEESDIVGDYFLVSIVWWANSSDSPFHGDAEVTLVVDSIDIHYREQSDVVYRSFADVFQSGTPELLRHTDAFYLITDKEYRLLSVNTGNLSDSMDTKTAQQYLEAVCQSSSKSGSITDYFYQIKETEEHDIILFQSDSYDSQIRFSLLWISIAAGAVIWVILLIVIIIISGYVIKPVEEAFRQQRAFISNASHELKTPLTVISTAIDILSRQKGEDKWTGCIREQSKKMNHLVGEMLDLSRLSEDKRQEAQLKRHDLSSIVKNSLLYFECRLFEMQKSLNMEIESDIAFLCDEGKISQLVGILMDNALKYSDEQSEIHVSLSRKKDRIVLSFSNSCSDFPIADTAKMFERFYRSDNDCSREQEGFGLGLSIAREIAGLHKGVITAEYENNNVTFTIAFKG